jgi:hypothetical protein
VGEEGYGRTERGDLLMMVAGANIMECSRSNKRKRDIVNWAKGLWMNWVEDLR